MKIIRSPVIAQLNMKDAPNVVGMRRMDPKCRVTLSMIVPCDRTREKDLDRIHCATQRLREQYNVVLNIREARRDYSSSKVV